MGCTRAVGCGLLAIVYLLISISGCAGNGNGLDANGRPIIGGSGGNVPLSADFDSIQSHIFTPICSVCHAGGSAPEGLRLDAANSYNLLVGVPSTEVPSVLRVKPGDPDNSYIIQKLEGHAAVGAQMPFGGPYLSTETIAFIRQWITDGAQPAATAAPAAALAITTSAPAANDVLGAAPPQVMVGFNAALDATRIDPESARIERLTPDEPAPLAPVAARVALLPVNPRALLLWPAAPLPPGNYRVVLRSGLMNDSGDTVVTTFAVKASP
jgi:hypothetical protein